MSFRATTAALLPARFSSTACASQACSAETTGTSTGVFSWSVTFALVRRQQRALHRLRVACRGHHAPPLGDARRVRGDMTA
jgi:hypothetical protein